MTRMVTVFEGAPWEAQLLRGRFEEDAIPSHIPYATIKGFDPFATGANPLSFGLQVPATLAERASGLVDEYLAATRRPAGEEPPAGEDRLVAERARASRLGLRLGWALTHCLLTPLGIPFVIYVGGHYLRATRNPSVRPPGHRGTCALFVAVIVVYGVFGLAIAFGDVIFVG
ncbi:MAG: hypothetical protein ACC662_09635 [Planctomycetota bacterium]